MTMEPLAYALGTLIHSVHQMLPPCGRLVKRIKSSLWLKQIFLMPLSIFLKFYCKICFFTTISRYLHEQPIAHRPYALWQDNSSSMFPLASSPQHLSCTPDDHSGEGSLLPTIILSRRLIASPTSYNEPIFKYTLEKKSWRASRKDGHLPLSEQFTPPAHHCPHLRNIWERGLSGKGWMNCMESVADACPPSFSGLRQVLLEKTCRARKLKYLECSRDAWRQRLPEGSKLHTYTTHDAHLQEVS